MLKLFALSVSFIFYVAASASTIKFYSNAAERKVLCQASVPFHGYYYIEYADDNSIKFFEHLVFKNDTLIFSNSSKVVSFDKFISDNKLSEIKENPGFDAGLFVAHSKIISQTNGVHQTTGDSVLLFKSVFTMAYKTKTIVTDTFEYNYTHLVPAYTPVVIRVFSDEKHTYSFVHHSWSVEKEYDVYSKYEDYVVVVE
jgi:hypothetical protein